MRRRRPNPYHLALLVVLAAVLAYSATHWETPPEGLRGCQCE